MLRFLARSTNMCFSFFSVTTPFFFFFLERQKTANLPAEGHSIEAFGRPVVNDDDVMLLLQKALQGVGGVPHDVALVAPLVGCPPEPITLGVFFGKHQHDLKGAMVKG